MIAAMKQTTRTRSFGLIGALVATWAILAAAIPSAAMAQTKLTLGYSPANAFIAAFVAKEQGFFAKRGLDVTMQLVPSGPTMPGALVSGSIQIGTLTPPPLLLAVEAGIELQAIAGATYAIRSDPLIAVVARDGALINKPADFVGKKVAVPGISASLHVAFQKWLKNAGVDPKQVSFVEVNFPLMSDLLKAGQVDAALTVEPFLARIQHAKTGTVVAPYMAELTDAALEAFYATTKAYASSNPKVVADFREALREAIAWIPQNLESARRTQITYVKLPEIVAMNVRLPRSVVDIKTEDMQFWVDLCREFGVTRGQVTAGAVLFR